jgi:hypothetical protein
MTYTISMEEYVDGEVVDTQTFTFDSKDERDEAAEMIWRSYTMVTEASIEDGFDTGWLMLDEE